MSREEIIDYILDLFDEIQADSDEAESKSIFNVRPGGGFLMLFIPHLIGVICGIAISYGLKLTPEAYLVMAIVCGFTFGVIKSAVFDKMNLGRATIKNFLAIFLFAVLLFIAYLLKFKV